MKKIFFACSLFFPAILSSMIQTTYESRTERIARMYQEAQTNPLLHDAFLYATEHTLEKNSEYIPLEDARYAKFLQEWGIIDQINYMPLGIHRILRLHYAPKIQKSRAERVAQEEAIIRKKIYVFYTESELDRHMHDALAQLALHALKNDIRVPFTHPSYATLLQSEEILESNGCLSPLAHKILCSEYVHLAQKLIAEQEVAQKHAALHRHITQCYHSTETDAQRAFVLAFYHTEKNPQNVPMPKHRCNALLQRWGFIDSNLIMNPEVYDILKQSYASSTGLRTGYFVFPQHDHVNYDRLAKIKAMIQAQRR